MIVILQKLQLLGELLRISYRSISLSLQRCLVLSELGQSLVKALNRGSLLQAKEVHVGDSL